jgi:transposase
MRLEKIDASKRVYIDESGIRKDLVREYGYSQRGSKIEDVKRGRKFRRLNVIGAKLEGEVFAVKCYAQNANGVFFEDWFEKELLAKMPGGYTFIMDNASFHRKNRLGEIAKKYGGNLLFLPAYSPDYNPIEKAWANMKKSLVDIIPKYDALEESILFYFKKYSDY